jgi:thymidylate synthase
MNKTDLQYKELVNDVLNNGVLHPTRAKINGKNISAYTVFGRQARFNFAEGFPILTTKKVSFDSLAHELVWFLSGDSNIKYLKDNNIKIWDAWADESGELGYGTYGTMWRNFPFYDDAETQLIGGKEVGLNYKVYEDKWGNPTVVGGIDQIKQLIDNIETVKKDPVASCGRRLIVTAWHPYYIDKIPLPPCHCLFQFHISGNKLSCQLYQRSCDLFLGVPFNISSYCLLLSVIAHITNLVPHEFIHTYGDLHIYENHLPQILEQIKINDLVLPKLWIDPDLKSIEGFKRESVKLVGYKHQGVIRGEVAV